jgi:predicted regulator of Ras-like GTPase activity (Roadblock/LC7/MglB family)
MTQLDEALQRVQDHEGVEHVLLVGMDGLLIRHVGGGDSIDPDRVAAMVPGVVTAAGSLGHAAGGGDPHTAVLELAEGVAVLTPLSEELLLAVMVRRGVGFSSLLRDVRRDRGRLAALV